MVRINNASRSSLPPTEEEEKTGFIQTANIHSDSDCILCVDEMGSGGFSSHTKQISVEE